MSTLVTLWQVWKPALRALWQVIMLMLLGLSVIKERPASAVLYATFLLIIEIGDARDAILLRVCHREDQRP